MKSASQFWAIIALTQIEKIEIKKNWLFTELKLEIEAHEKPNQQVLSESLTHMRLEPAQNRNSRPTDKEL